jgi:hypothetical protein
MRKKFLSRQPSFRLPRRFQKNDDPTMAHNPARICEPVHIPNHFAGSANHGHNVELSAHSSVSRLIPRAVHELEYGSVI